MNWLYYQWERFLNWWGSWEQCPKEQMGYRCRHRVLSNGTLECGKEHNYWKGDQE